MRYAAILLLAVSIAGSSVSAQTFEDCADISGDGNVNVSDWIRYFEAFGGLQPLPLGKGDIDGRQEINAGDMRYMASWLFQGLPDGSCPPSPPYVLNTGPDTVFLPTYDVPAGTGTFTLPVIMATTQLVSDLVLPLKINGLDASMVLDSFQVSPIFQIQSAQAAASAYTYVDEIGFFFSYLTDVLHPGVHLIGTAFFSYTGSTGGTVGLDTTSFATGGSTNYVYGNIGSPGNYDNLTIGIPEIVITPTTGHPTMTLDVDTLFYTTLAGYPDPDSQTFTVLSDGAPLDWFLTSASPRLTFDKTSGVSGETVTMALDIAGLGVGIHVYTVTVYSTNALGSPQTLVVWIELRQQFPSLDANCDGTYNSADLIWQVNYLFKGGTLPCNPCTGQQNEP